MAATYEIRDPIHGTITITEAERRVIDHPWIQRLRSIRQLGFVSLVYPGAVHDRFQHSLGVMHLAGERLERLYKTSPQAFAGYSDADRRHAHHVLRLAGMLHDSGHPPFSHTCEAYLPPVEQVLLPADWYRIGQLPQSRQATHEDFSLALIAGLVREGVLAEDVARDVAAVLSSRVRRSKRLSGMGSLVSVLRALVSGELDADRCDYLLRDSHFAGVSYGIYDLERLKACEVVLPGPYGPELGLDIHGVHALEELLLARYHMFLQVYFHKTPPAFEHYLAMAIGEGEIDVPLARGLSDLVDLRDDSVTMMLHAARAKGGRWSRRILDREPAKLVLRERVGAEDQENFLAQELVGALRQSGCNVFTCHSRQVFTKLAGAGGPQAGGAQEDSASYNSARLLCERRVLGRRLVEPITGHSQLLASFNKPIDLRHTYVLREDVEKATAVMDKLQAW
ncbi:MAG: HD domain-containing protein [Planctomycetes bacterium]|nr:HD domain-containing protein [Planctomycetota bacterium]